MNKVFQTIVIMILPIICSATAQFSDIFIWNNDTFPLHSCPLESHKDIDNLRPKLFDIQTCTSTACGRGYYAEWTIKNNELYLTNIYSCCYSNDGVKTNLKKYFPDGKAKAIWFTGELWVEEGKQTNYDNSGFGSVYETEYKLTIINSKVVSVKKYDNSKTKSPIYSSNSDTLFEFIYSRVNWSKLPSIEKDIKVYLSFQSSETGKISNIKILRGSEKIYNDEAIRVLELIPEWEVIYDNGQFMPRTWTLGIIFSKENKKKYAR